MVQLLPTNGNACASAPPPTLNPGPAVARETAIMRGADDALAAMTWVGLSSDKITISLKPLPAPMINCELREPVDLGAILASARHNISIDPKMACSAQANPTARAPDLLK